MMMDIFGCRKIVFGLFFFSSRRRHTRCSRDWSSDVCSSDLGGPEGMVATVENLTDITFDYYLLTGFEGMTRIFDALGGLRIDVPYSFKGYENTEFTEGPTTMTGAEALEFSRTRKSLSHGDFDRSMNH